MTLINAPIWKRILAFFYDGLIVIALFLIAGLIASILAQGEAPAFVTQSIILILIGGYFWVSYAYGGSTAGMRAWKLRVVLDNGDSLDKRTAVKRILWSGLCLAPLLIPMATAFFSPLRQTIYDRLSQTRVIFDPKFIVKDTASKLEESEAAE